MEKDYNLTNDIIETEYKTSKDSQEDTPSSNVDDSISKASLISYLIS